ncbi:MAG TPA: CHAT domain-containing protein [Cyanobacteria bacterium UBA8553]|nr:CHAT domain-containing protein [Cyanobacteria bacterium UBA8553]HAJ59786.1 CHAT domain-containing protein [Cyanobacteria bacterium UBA8543]
MKSIRLFIIIFLTALLFVICLQSVQAVQAQTGNQSDTTGPDPNEVVNNQSDTTGNDPQEILNNQSDTTGNDIQEILNPGQGDNSFSSGSSGEVRVDRAAFDSSFEAAGISEAINLFEEAQAVEFGQQLGLNLFGEVASAQNIAQTLDDLYRQRGKRAAILYVVSLPDKLQLLLILANNQPIRKIIPEANRALLQQVTQEFRSKVSDPGRNTTYLDSAQKLYQWIIAPFDSVLKANQIDTLVFSMDKGLRSIPIAALYDGQQFLIEKYSVSIIPSFSLTDTRYFPITNTRMLAVGISESTQGQTPLPAVAVEVSALTNKLWSGQKLLNETSTINNFQAESRQQRFKIIHIATHAEFRPGRINNSYIQFWNAKLGFEQLRQLSRELAWQQEPKVEMIVLSACRTALGDHQAELGFVGLALQVGVKTALGSLWAVRDEASLGLMTKFYEQLRTAPIRSEALQKAQLAMLKGQVRIESGKLRLNEQNTLSLPPELTQGSLNLSHPYYWSAFTMTGNWN